MANPFEPNSVPDGMVRIIHKSSVHLQRIAYNFQNMFSDIQAILSHFQKEEEE